MQLNMHMLKVEEPKEHRLSQNNIRADWYCNDDLIKSSAELFVTKPLAPVWTQQVHEGLDLNGSFFLTSKNS